MVFDREAHVWYARRCAHGFRQWECLVRSYQGYRPGVLVLAGSGRRLATPQRALGYRRSDTARQRLQRGSLRQAEVRPRSAKWQQLPAAAISEPAKVADAGKTRGQNML